jgi:hypothetical protein
LLRLLLGPIPVGSVASKVPLGFNFVLKSFILLRGFFANNLVRQLRAQASRWRVWGVSCVGCKGCRRCFPSAAAEHPEQKKEHFLFSIIYGIIIPTDFHIFQRGRSTTNQIF